MTVIEHSEYACPCGRTTGNVPDERYPVCHGTMRPLFVTFVDLRQQLVEARKALRVADDLLRQFSISANDHSELIRREFGKAQWQINDALGWR